MFFFFFFSSRRRHTRYWRDWSSDVCSSDLRELGPHGIRVNTIAPGWVETDATAGLEAGKLKAASETPLGARIAQPEDIAGAIYLLALGEAQFLTGTYITVNGGYSML